MGEQNNTAAEEVTISLADILQIIRKRLVIICCIIAAALGVTSIFTFFIQKPVYRASGTMIVAYEGLNEAASTQYNFAKLISDTYVVFIKDIVLDEVAEDTELSKIYLEKHLTITNDSLLLKISYEAENPEFSQVVVRSIMDKALEIADSVDENGVPRYKMLNDNLKIISEAQPGTKVSSVLKNLLIGVVLGVVLAAAVVFVLELVDKSFRTHDEIERALALPVLATIPYYEFKDEDKEGEKKDV